jgi:hypothetical protein
MAPAVAAAPAATAGGGAFIRAALAELLGNVGGEILNRASTGVGRLGEAPPATKENLNRAILRLATLGMVDLPEIDVRERIEEDVNRQRAMAQELGQRERALAEINASAQIIPALAQLAGAQAAATGGAAQEFLRTYLARPDFQASLSTIGTGK